MYMSSLLIVNIFLNSDFLLFHLITYTHFEANISAFWGEYTCVVEKPTTPFQTCHVVTSDCRFVELSSGVEEKFLHMCTG